MACASPERTSSPSEPVTPHKNDKYNWSIDWSSGEPIPPYPLWLAKGDPDQIQEVIDYLTDDRVSTTVYTRWRIVECKEYLNTREILRYFHYEKNLKLWKKWHTALRLIFFQHMEEYEVNEDEWKENVKTMAWMNRMMPEYVVDDYLKLVKPKTLKTLQRIILEAIPESEWHRLEFDVNYNYRKPRPQFLFLHQDCKTKSNHELFLLDRKDDDADYQMPYFADYSRALFHAYFIRGASMLQMDYHRTPPDPNQRENTHYMHCTHFKKFDDKTIEFLRTLIQAADGINKLALLMKERKEEAEADAAADLYDEEQSE